MSIKSADDDIEENRLTRESAQDLVDEIIRKYGREISAREVLHEHEELRQFRSCVVDLAYEEYANAREQGVEIPATDFVRQFEGVEQSLYRMLEFDQLLRENPSLVEPVPEDRWPRKGQEFLNFQLLSDVGRGALSRVFLARHTQLGDKAVIVKVCVRGEQEAGLLGSLVHPAIGEVHSITTDATSGLSVICMPYQTRCTIHDVAEWIDNEQREDRSLPTPEQISQHVQAETRIEIDGMETEAFRDLATGYYADDDFDQLVAKWGVELCGALQRAHEKDVLHCDVKPGNILVLPDLSVRLLDFNLATRREDQARMAGGTPPFMAPEQLRLMMQMAERPQTGQPNEPPAVVVDDQADVFGLCATLWHLLTGEPPFGTTAEYRTPADAALTMLTRHTMGVGSNIVQKARKRAPSELVDVLLQGLAADRDARFRSIADLREALGQCIRPRRERSYWGIAAASVVLAIAVGASAYLYVDPAGTALNSARQLYVAGEFDEARDVLKNYRSDSKFSQVWDLAFRTALTPMLLDGDGTLVYRNNPGNRRSEDYELQRADELPQEWMRLTVRWEQLARESPHEMECWYNAYLCHLESTPVDLRGWKLAQQSFDNAVAAGLDPEKHAKDVMLLRLWGEANRPASDQGSHPELVDLAALQALTEDAGNLSRGQFRILNEVFHEATLAAAAPQQAALINLQRSLLSLLASEDRPIEPSGVWYILGNLRDPEAERTVRQKWRVKTGLPNGHTREIPVPNRLSKFLILPQQAVGDVWAAGQGVGLTVADSLNLLQLEAPCQTKTPGQDSSR